MPLLDDLRSKISQNAFEFSKHAVDQTILRNISVQEIRDVINNGEIIEDYTDDKYGPSCLIFGVTQIGRPIHIQCSYPSRPIVKVVTVYEPNPDRWIDYKVRR